MDGRKQKMMIFQWMISSPYKKGNILQVFVLIWGDCVWVEGGNGVYKIMMQPIAYLALLNLPGENKLRNLKYFLGRGDNVVGTDGRCQIVLPAKYEMPHHVANIRVGHNFLTIEALHPHLLYLQANLTRSGRESQADNYFPLPTVTQFLPKLGEFFFIGRIKAVIAAPPSHELILMKNIVNASSFQHTYLESARRKGFEKREQRQILLENATLEDTVPPVQPADLFQQFAVSGRKVDSGKPHNADRVAHGMVEQEKSHTEVLDDENYQAEATLVLDEGIYAYQPTINLDQPPQEAVRPVNYSQQRLMDEIRRKEERVHEEEIDFSMPDTIIDKDNEHAEEQHEQKPHIEQVESKEEQAEQAEQGEEEMPPTIKEEQEETVNRIKPTKTMVTQPKVPHHERLYKSGPLPNDSSKKQEPSHQKPIEDFMDLFGMSGPSGSALKHKGSEPVAASKDLQMMQVSSFKLASLPEKSLQSQSKKQEVGLETQRQRVHFVGFKPTAAHREFLKQQHFEIVGSPDSEYHILLVKEPIRICNRLLLALIAGKRIETEQWIFNKQAEIQSKPNGFAWRTVYEKRGTQGQLLKGRGRFYVSKRLEELLDGVVQAMGGELTTELVDKKRVLNVILRADDSQDTEIYLKHHENKKWRFLKSEAIVDAALTGKYALEEKYIIKLFND